RTQNSALQTLQDFSYQFDPIGNVSAITDSIHTGSQSFQYDDLNRLTQASGSYGVLSYAYDPIGNLIEKEGATLTYGANGVGPHAGSSGGSSGDTYLIQVKKVPGIR
ncbi:MAG: hypothetical protein HYY57_00180, partial [Candidatus Omnitrophica bacterium]|nr:hypothetical protein [Candidatus Omnitrophota bacterium]